MHDATASLRTRAVEVELGGWVFTIDALPAADWIEAVQIGDLAAIFPGLLRDRALENEIWTLLMEGAITREDLVMAAHGALSTAAGRPWWEAQRLVSAAMHERASAVVLGNLVRAGFDFGTRPLAAFLDAAYSFAVQDRSEESRMRLDIELRTPPPGVDVEEVDALFPDDEAEAEFMAALGDTGSGV
jgi:hypothetical protein